MRVLPRATIVASLFLVSACATHETTKSGAASTLASHSKYSAMLNSEADAQKSHVWGDKYTAANLFLQAYEADPTIKNRFNLATAYDSIGKRELALDMYGALVKDGQYVRLSEVYSNDLGPKYIRDFNVSDESQLRINAIEARGPGPTGAIGEEKTGNSTEEARMLDLAAEKEGTPSQASFPR